MQPQPRQTNVLHHVYLASWRSPACHCSKCLLLSNLKVPRWRSRWTWPPWVICALAFNHKRKKFCIFRGILGNRFLKETLQLDGRTKNWIMKRLLHGTLRLKNSPTGEQIQNGRPTDEITRAHHCSVLVFLLQKLLCWKFCNFLLPNKAVYLLMTDVSLPCQFIFNQVSRERFQEKPASIPRGRGFLHLSKNKAP